MTKTQQKFIELAANEIGQKGAKYCRAYGRPIEPWCAYFVSYCSKQAGMAGKIITESGGAGSIPRESCARNQGTWYEQGEISPQAGDVILFCWNGLGSYKQDKYFSDHVGIIESVINGVIHTIEGNANGSNENSTVCRKSYPQDSIYINGIYRPNWGKIDKDNNATGGNGVDELREVEQWVNTSFGCKAIVNGKLDKNDLYALCGAYQYTLNRYFGKNIEVDGIVGNETGYATPILRQGANNVLVKIAQGALILRGYNTGGFDGVFGVKTDSAVRQLQSVKGLFVDGEIGHDTLIALLRADNL